MGEMMPEQIVYEVERRVATVTLNHPERLNAISPQMQHELIAAIEEAERDDRVRVMIVQGAGRSFCVGYNVVETRTDHSGTPIAASISRDHDRLRQFNEGWLRIWDARLPIIAQVHGHCIGGGTQLATICDVTFVAEEARVGAPQLPLGAGFVASFWAWHIGAKKAKEIFFPVGTLISGTEAVDIGLFNCAVPAAQLDERVREYAHRVAKTPKEILALQKQAINRTQDLQGFRQALMQGAEIDAMAHFTEPVIATNQRIHEVGLRATIAEWNAQD
jgi:enoyl-CoA hydratase